MLKTDKFLHNLRSLKKCWKCWRDLGHLEEGKELDFAYTHVIMPMQVRSEIESLLEIVQDANPNTILEIGTATGGTLFLFCRRAPENSLVVSIDLRKGRFGQGYPLAKIPLYKSFAGKRQKITLIRGNSHLEGTRRRAKKALNGRPIDFLFIDGDHTYDGVKADFETYSKYVAPGGIVAFHDIAEHPPSVGCEVSHFWNEIKSRYRHAELIENPLQGWAGIGVLYV